MEIVLFAKLSNGVHHGRGMMFVDSLLIGPAINEQNGFRIIQRLVILIPQITFLSSDGINSATGNHLLSELPGIPVCTSVSQIDCYRHTLFLFISAASRKKKKCG